MRVDRRQTLWLLCILLFAFLLRFTYALDHPTLRAFANDEGGDSGWYLANGAGFFSGQEHGRIRGLPFYISKVSTPPLYLLFVGIIQQLLPDHETIIAIRLIQCLASTATVYLAFRLGTVIARDRRAGLVAAALTAFHPAMIMEPANIATETLYIFFLAVGLWLYTEYAANACYRRERYRVSPDVALTLAALAFGLATLTRAVAILFPLGIALHLILLGRHGYVRSWRKSCIMLLLVYSAFVSTWTIHSFVLWDRIIVVSDQLMPALWRAAESNDGSPEQNDRLLMEGVEITIPEGCEIDCNFQHSTETFVKKISAIVEADPAGLLALRASELVYSILQPHGTTALGDVSIVEAGRVWLTESRTLDGLLQVVRIEGFANKLAVWIFHYCGIIFGLPGMIWTRKQWQIALPLTGFVFYTIAAHFFLLALPRYLFPIEFVWFIFAGVAIIRIYDRWRRQTSGEGD